jgi:hypothetical protein
MVSIMDLFQLLSPPVLSFFFIFLFLAETVDDVYVKKEEEGTHTHTHGTHTKGQHLTC